MSDYGYVPRPLIAATSAFNPAQALKQVNAELERLYSSNRGGPIVMRKIQKLENMKTKIAAKLGAQRGAQIALQGQAGSLGGAGIRGMDAVEEQFGPEVIHEYNVNQSAQGARYTSVAPPGSGNLTSVPFVTAGASNPAQSLVAGAAGVVGATGALVTTAISWAVVKIVGLTTQTYAAATGAAGVMQDLKMGGSPNLILTEGWVAAEDYDVDRDQFVGLRAYPTLRSPNVAQLTVAARGGTAGAEAVIIGFSLVVTVLRDDAFGPGLPGPYAV